MSPCAAALIRPSKLITTSTAAFCRMCCASWSRRREARSAGHARHARIYDGDPFAAAFHPDDVLVMGVQDGKSLAFPGSTRQLAASCFNRRLQVWLTLAGTKVVMLQISMEVPVAA